MSQLEIALFVAECEKIQVAATADLAITALFFYDYVLTLSREVQYVWQRRFSGVTALFVLNRYAVMSGRLVRLIQLQSWHGYTVETADHLCTIAWRWSEISTIVMYMSAASFSALQAYAMYGRDKRILSLIMIIGTINPIVNLGFDATVSFLANGPPTIGCAQKSALGERINLIFFISGSVLTLIFEAAVFALIWRRFADVLSTMRRSNIKTPFTTLLWRDGSIYFVTLVVLTTLNLLSIFPSLQNLNVPALADTLASICLSRYVLHLRETGLTGGPSNTSLHLSRMSDVRFVQTSAVVQSLRVPDMEREGGMLSPRRAHAATGVHDTNE